MVYGLVTWLPAAVVAMIAASAASGRFEHRRVFTWIPLLISAICSAVFYLTHGGTFTALSVLLIVAAAGMYAPYGPDSGGRARDQARAGRTASPTATARCREIISCYDINAGSDLADGANQAGLSAKSPVQVLGQRQCGRAVDMEAVNAHLDALPERERRILGWRFGGNLAQAESTSVSASSRCT